MNINKVKLNEFINDTNIPLDEIFNEFNNIMNIPQRLLNEEEQPQQVSREQMRAQLQQEIAEMKQIYIETYNRYKEESMKRKLTPEELEHIRKMEMILAEKLEQEAIMIQQDMQNPEVIRSIQQNPNGYANQHPASINTIPAQYRKVAAPPPEEKSEADKMIGQAFNFAVAQVQGQLFNQIIIVGIFGSISSFILKMIGAVWLKIHEFLFGTGSGAYIPERSQRIIYQHADTGEVLDTTRVVSFDYRNQETGSKFINNTTGKEINPTDIAKDYAVLGGDELKNSDKPTRFSNEGVIGKITGISNDNFKGYGYLAKWAVLAIVISLILYLVYKYLTRKVEKKKKEDYSQMQNKPVQEVTIPMLCEYDDHNFEYFAKLESLDEGIIGDFFSKILPTRESIKNRIIKAFETLKGTIAAANEYLRDEVGAPGIAKFALRIAAWGCVIFPIGIAALSYSKDK